MGTDAKQLVEDEAHPFQNGELCSRFTWWFKNEHEFLRPSKGWPLFITYLTVSRVSPAVKKMVTAFFSFL